MATTSQRLAHWLRVLQWRLFPHEPETRFLDRRLPRGAFGVFVDVGANYGMYAHIMRAHARDIVCFEPNPVRLADLNTLLASPHCRIEPKGVDATPGRAHLRVPMRDGAPQVDVGTISTANGFETEAHDTISETEIETVSLDSYFLESATRVGMVKIDVEGNETAVIEGAHGLIARDRPLFLIETELRHSPHVRALFDAMAQAGYDAYYLARNNRLTPVHFDDVAGLQSADKLATRLKHPLSRVYVNNYFFLHPDNPATARLL